MSLRNLVTGRDACAPSEANRRSNVIGNLANTLLERAQASDRARNEGASSSNLLNFFDDALQLEDSQKPNPNASQLQPIQEMDPQKRFAQEFRKFKEIFDAPSTSQEMSMSNGVHERNLAVSEALKQFLTNARDDIPYLREPLPLHLCFDPLEQTKIQSRVRHLCHVLFADHGREYVEMQILRFLESLRIAPEATHLEAFDNAWNQSFSSATQIQHPLSHQWAADFQRSSNGFHPTRPFESEQRETATLGRPIEFREKENNTLALIQQMENDPDPKFRNSKFLQFVQKLNNGEFVIEGNQIEEQSAEKWVTEFTRMQQQGQPFSTEAQLINPWLEEFKQQTLPVSNEERQDYGLLEGGWVDQNEVQEWLDSYEQMAYGPEEEEKEYEFASNNPFLGAPDALLRAQDLFSRGNLSDAVLTTEAAIKQGAAGTETWILLGRIHAENNSDDQAIAAFHQAREIDPSHGTACLELAVSHANELHESKTVDALMAWLDNHKTYRFHPVRERNPPPDPSQKLSFAMRVFHELLLDQPTDVDVLVALGVLHHLGRNYPQAIDLFRSAAELRPNDYTLWNKLGAAQANAARSSEAIHSYQRCLEQKSTYMKGWANLAISYANLGDHHLAVQHCVRALALNKDAETVWGSLKSYAICAGLMDLLDAINARDIDFLRRYFNV